MRRRVLLTVIAEFLVLIGLRFIPAGTLGPSGGGYSWRCCARYRSGSPYVDQERP